jgi:hypothetical protein
MGFNTTVVFNNDAVHCMEDDPEIGRKLHQAICMVSSGSKVDVHTKGGTVATVIETHHADITTVIAVGNNDGEQIGAVHLWRQDDGIKEKILRELADSMGYYVAKKPRKKHSVSTVE